MFKLPRAGWLVASCAAVATALLVAACGTGDGGNTSTTAAVPAPTPAAPAPKTIQSIKHVFVITLENQNYATTFAANSKAPYLSQTLVSQGAHLQQYYGTTHVSLGNYVAMLSGQAVTPDTQMDCQVYKDFALSGMADHGQAIGTGCVYPTSIKTLPDQLKAVGLTWKGYMEDMGNDPTRESATCGHPTLNTQDKTQSAQAATAGGTPADMYATRHNPFAYFHSIIDSPDCATNVVNLNGLATDLQSINTTANFTFITPNLCNDGHDSPCVTGAPGGLVSADAFLQKWVPLIMASPAYQQDGLLIINFDESAYASQTMDTTTTPPTLTMTFTGQTCCNQQPGPNVTFPITQSFPASVSHYPYNINLVTQSHGGDRTGAVLLSPFIKPGTVSTTQYNHYALLKTLEDIFQVGGYLGYASQEGLQSMGSDVFTNLN
ncbi:alkaline phosphatase family protein [Ralstonia insidiosa]|uniref:Phosphoesterase n=1 Tax=Ralstonia insidiosa TaxID=190721 RepID=A0A192A3Y2_9RALS|nr:alkaline phosphatase family protein [Ralstonia insidiosa]ANJ74992.1 phosphoesterase [Ralstonia insidiosa]KAB0468289.1 phosphoesterase [Ralstonia insidiosa]MBY4910990.1 alkaline phosphatase family protein [Ralstonia insidiosa]